MKPAALILAWLALCALAVLVLWRHGKRKERQQRTSRPSREWYERTIRQSMDAEQGVMAAGALASGNCLPNGIADMPMRVACITLDGTTLTMPAGDLPDRMGIGNEGDDDTYTLRFKTITVGEYRKLGEFDGF